MNEVQERAFAELGYDYTTSFVPLDSPPQVGDIVFHDSDGLIEYRVTENYAGRHREQYPEIVLVEVIRDYGDGFFKPGHLSVRPLEELLKRS